MNPLHRCRPQKSTAEFIKAWCVMRLCTYERRAAALVILSLVPSFILQGNALSGWAMTARSGREVKRAPTEGTVCGECGAAASNRGRKILRGKNGTKRPAVLPCHPPGYVDPRLARDFNAALREMKRAGIEPEITSTWRSSGDQNKMYQCSMSRRCRISHPGLYRALPPGQSVHEAGFAVDISGIATGPRGSKHLTAQGRRIVRIMERHGFRWRYGLMDPVHFEADPREHGYLSLRQAILINQTRCQAAVAQKRAAKQHGETAGTRVVAKRHSENAGTRASANRKGEKPATRGSARQQAIVKVAQRKTPPRDHKRLPRA
jgi:hypothetical protein